MLTKDKIIEIAKTCFDPEIPVNIWDLGLIYDIGIEKDGELVTVRMTLTSQACPMAQEIPQDLRQKILDDTGAKEVDIDIVFDPPWTPERISAEAKKKLGIEEA